MEGITQAESEGGQGGIETDIERILRLVNSGSSLRDVMVKGMSVLNYCCSMYDEDTALLVLGKGVDVDVSEAGSRGFTPLHFAVDGILPEVVQALINARADLTAATEDMRIVQMYESGGRTPLHLAAAQGDTDVLRMLLAARADVAKQDLDGNNPFILACMKGHTDMASLLLRPDERTHTPSKEWMSSKKEADQRLAADRARQSTVVTGVFREVHVIPKVWTLEECAKVLAEVQKVTSLLGWAQARHSNHATTDIQSCEIPACDSWVRGQLREKVFPAMADRYFKNSSPGPAPCDFRLRDLFFVKYDTAGQSYLGLHRDGSVLSFNILLNDPDTFKGGGTFIEEHNETYHIGQGDCFLHSGQLLHGGGQLTDGCRFVLVGFVDVKQSFLK